MEKFAKMHGWIQLKCGQHTYFIAQVYWEENFHWIEQFHLENLIRLQSVRLNEDYRLHLKMNISSRFALLLEPYWRKGTAEIGWMTALLFITQSTAAKRWLSCNEQRNFIENSIIVTKMVLLSCDSLKLTSKFNVVLIHFIRQYGFDSYNG